MSNWTNDFLGQCLSTIPSRAYRKRLEQELTDHLNELAADLEAGGRSSQEARAEALKQMGDPAKLARSYQDEWRRQSLLPKYYMPLIWEGIVQTWAGCMLCRLLFSSLFVDSALALSIAELYAVHPLVYAGFFAAVTFLPGLLRGGFMLGRSFSYHPYRRGMMGLGLLLAWAVEKIPLYLLFIAFFVKDGNPLLSTWDILIWAGEEAYPFLLPSYFAITFVLTALVWGISALRQSPNCTVA